MRPLSLVALLSSLSCLGWWAAVGCGSGSLNEERASTQTADLALRHLEHTSPHHSGTHR
jgi:hypothetical protein